MLSHGVARSRRMFLTNTIVEENEELANWVNQMLKESGNVSRWTSIKQNMFDLGQRSNHCEEVTKR